MTVSLKQARRVKEFCVNEYFAKLPYSIYVNGIGIAKVGFMEPDASDKDDLCVKIYLRKKLPRNLSIPKEKYGVKIYTEIIGEIRLL